jgi:hypothetical protein
VLVKFNAKVHKINLTAYGITIPNEVVKTFKISTSQTYQISIEKVDRQDLKNFFWLKKPFLTKASFTILIPSLLFKTFQLESNKNYIFYLNYITPQEIKVTN